MAPRIIKMPATAQPMPTPTLAPVDKPDDPDDPIDDDAVDAVVFLAPVCSVAVVDVTPAPNVDAAVLRSVALHRSWTAYALMPASFAIKSVWTVPVDAVFRFVCVIIRADASVVKL